jgi:acyl carrier protein
VNFGPWEVGMAARPDRHARTRGVTPLTAQQALHALGGLISTSGPQSQSQSLVANIEWRDLVGATPPPMLSQLVTPKKAQHRAPAGLVEKLRAAGPRERRETLVGHVRAEVARVMGLHDLAPAMDRKSFTDMGMSSLMVMELRNSLEAELGQGLTATAMFNAPTVELLAAHIAREVLGVDERTAAPPAALAAEIPTIDASSIAGLSENEVEALLLPTIERIK